MLRHLPSAVLRGALAPLLAMIAALSLDACASGVGIVPVGGPPDTTAPSIISSTPASGTRNFTGTEVTIGFDEYIQESRIGDFVTITPIPLLTPDFDWSGRELTIEFQQPLAPNRTYAITFGSGITDLSNNRLAQPVTIRFSTGATIDSGSTLR